MLIGTCLLLSLVQLTTLVLLNSVNVAESADVEFTVLKADAPPIPGARECSPICKTIVQKGVAMYKEISTTTIPVSMYYLGDVAPFSYCRFYGANTIQLHSYKCTTDSERNLYDNDWEFTWHNLSVECIASVDKSAANMVSTLTQSDKSKSEMCGTEIPFDKLPYSKVECPANQEEDQSKKDAKAPVAMTVSLGKMKFMGRLRTDKGKGFSYPSYITGWMKTENPLTFRGVQSGYEASIECLKANKETVVRRLLKGFFGSAFPCVMGVDSTYGLLKALALYIYSCINLPPLWQLIFSHPPIMNKI